MNFKEKLQTVLQKLKLWDKAKANQLTHEEWAQIVNSYEKEYQATLQDDLAAYHVEQQANVISPEQITQVQTILDGIINPMQSSATEEPGTENNGAGRGATAARYRRPEGRRSDHQHHLPAANGPFPGARRYLY